MTIITFFWKSTGADNQQVHQPQCGGGHCKARAAVLDDPASGDYHHLHQKTTSERQSRLKFTNGER